MSEKPPTIPQSPPMLPENRSISGWAIIHSAIIAYWIFQTSRTRRLVCTAMSRGDQRKLEPPTHQTHHSIHSCGKVVKEHQKECCVSELTWCQIHSGCWLPKVATRWSPGIYSQNRTDSIHGKAEILPFLVRVQRWKSVRTWLLPIWLQKFFKLLYKNVRKQYNHLLRYLFRHGTCWSVQTFGGSLLTVIDGSWKGTQSHNAFALRMRQLRMQSERVYFSYNGFSSENRHWRFSAL